MIFQKTKLDGVYLIDIEAIKDNRGFFARSFCKEEFSKHNLNSNIEQCNLSFNKKKGTIRGMHFQISPHEETKIVSVQHGAIFDVIIDLRKNSATYKQWEGFNLSARNKKMLYIPEGFAHGFQTLEDNTLVSYKMGSMFYPSSARGILYNDKVFGINWYKLPVTISEKDLSYPEFK